MTKNSNKSVGNDAVFEVRPNWVKLAVLVFYVCLPAAVGIVFFIAGIGEENQGLALKWIGAVVFVIGFAVILILIPAWFFYAIRNRWTLRAFPESLAFRALTQNLSIPWDDIEQISWDDYGVIIPIRPDSETFRILKKKRIYFFSEKDYQGRSCLSLPREWMNQNPEKVAAIIESHRKKYSS